MKEDSFANRKQTQPNAHEEAIAAELWRWAFATPSEQAEITAIQSDLCGRIEFYIDGPLHYDEQARAQNIWCDGVFELSITKTSRVSFKLVGMGHFPDSIAPFELELHFARRRDLQPIKTIARLGTNGRNGRIGFYSREKMGTAYHLLTHPPRKNSGWDVAIEVSFDENGQEKVRYLDDYSL